MERKFLDYEGLSLFKDNIVQVIKDNATDSVTVSQKEGNQIVKETDGIYVAPIQLDGYVEKEDGKSLISDEEITRLASVSNYDDTDVKKDIKSNADAIEILNGNSETEGSVQKQINDALAGITGFDVSVVETLPEEGVKGVFYLILNNGSEDDNVYDEYIWNTDSFEKIGTTKVDLTDYAKKEELAKIATTTEVGLVKPDESSMVVTEDGTLSPNFDVVANQDDVEYLKYCIDDMENIVPTFVDYEEDELYEMIWEKLEVIEKPEYTEEDIDALLDSIDINITIGANQIPYGDSTVKDALDNLQSKAVEISKEANNQIVNKEDGLYVAPPSEMSGGNTVYDNSKSGLEADNIQDAIDEIATGYVVKEDGKSLISDTEIERLASVDNYDDTEIKSTLDGLATVATSGKYTDLTETPTDVSSFNNDAGYITADDLPGIATDENVGLVKPDNTSIKVDDSGALSIVEVPVVEITWDEYINNKDYYDELNSFISISDGVDIVSASKVNFSRVHNNFVADNVQDAIEEVNGKVPAIETEDINFNIF